MTVQLNIWPSAALFAIHCRDSSISCSWCSNEVFYRGATLSKLSSLPRSRLVSLASLVCQSVSVSYLTADLHSPKYMSVDESKRWIPVVSHHRTSRSPFIFVSFQLERDFIQRTKILDAFGLLRCYETSSSKGSTDSRNSFGVAARYSNENIRCLLPSDK
jgi:hypothetical protein